MKISVKILESQQQIQNEILKGILYESTDYMNSVVTYIKKELQFIINKAITNTPEYMSLVSGILRLELGIPDASSKIAQLITIWSNNIEYDYKPPTISSGTIKSSFSAGLVKRDFSDVLGSQAAYVHDNIKGYSLPWLEWLLLDGRRIIVPKHSVIIGPNSRSRTGMAVMRPSNSSWRIPSEFTGTISNNWITRALDNASKDIQDLLERAMK